MNFSAQTFNRYPELQKIDSAGFAQDMEKLKQEVYASLGQADFEGDSLRYLGTQPPGYV
jgi:hypothetical protein